MDIFITIEVSFAPDNEMDDREFWLAVGQSAFQKAYGDDEPDYSQATLLEPNPKYGL